MANLINDIKSVEKDLPGVVDEVFSHDSFTEALIGSGAVKVDFLDARTVRIFKLASTGLYNYKRGGQGQANEQGAVQSAKETFYLTQERYSDIPLDKLDDIDDGGTVLGKLAKTFIRTKVVPEFDCYRFSKWAGYTSLTIGNRKEGAIAANSIISEFNDALEFFAEQKVPQAELICYVNPKIMKLIRSTEELRKNLRDLDLKNVSFKVQAYENMPIVEVPSDTFYTNAQIGDGYYPAASSKKINFLIISRIAPIIVKKLDFAKVYNSNEQKLGFVGYSLTNLYYHDTFIPDNKVLAVYAHISDESAALNGSGLLVDAVKGASVGKTIINKVITQPSGQFFDKLYLCTTADAPAIGTSAAAFTEIQLGVEFAPDTTGPHNRIVAGVGGVVKCCSKDFEGNLPVGA